MPELRFQTPPAANSIHQRPGVEARDLALALDQLGPRKNMRRDPDAVCWACQHKSVHARGLCHSCYKTHAPRKPCVTLGCGRKRHAQERCGRCYRAAIASGEIAVVRPVGIPAAERFAASVTPMYGGCLVWTGHVDPRGRGRFTGEDGFSAQAHRYAWKLAFGDYPDLELDHRCRVGACVNVEHLEPVTRDENMRRMRVAHGFSPMTADDAEWYATAIRAWAHGANNFPVKFFANRRGRVLVWEVAP